MVQVVAVTMEGEGITWSDNDEVDNGIQQIGLK